MACASARARCWRASISVRPPKGVRWIKQMTEPTEAARRWPLIPTLLVLAAVAVMIALGVWQLQRKSDKERSEEHTSELQSLMRISYAVFCLKKKNKPLTKSDTTTHESTNET